MNCYCFLCGFGAASNVNVGVNSWLCLCVWLPLFALFCHSLFTFATRLTHACIINNSNANMCVCVSVCMCVLALCLSLPLPLPLRCLLSQCVIAAFLLSFDCALLLWFVFCCYCHCCCCYFFLSPILVFCNFCFCQFPFRNATANCLCCCYLRSLPRPIQFRLIRFWFCRSLSLRLVF